MSETAYESPMDKYEREEWENLTASEKALCLSYQRLLLTDIKPKNALILEINKIHEKHPDFHVGCIPCERAKRQENEEYFPEGA